MLLLLLVSCGVPSADFFDAYAEATCSRTESCDPAAFDEAFDDMDECVDFSVGILGVLTDADCLAACEYDRKAAGKCLGDVDDMSCDDLDSGNFPDSCDIEQIYTCDGGIEACAA